MFIINIEDINNECLYICDRHMAEKIMRNNIPLLSIQDDKYYFYKNNRLKTILLKGGEDDIE